MKYIKKFEKFSFPFFKKKKNEEPIFSPINRPESGDYVIFDLLDYVIHGFKGDDKYHKKENENVYEFFKNNIGQILEIEDRNNGDCYVKVKYDNKFTGPEFYGDDIFEFGGWFTEIEFFSKNKEDLESIIDQKKYNL